MYVKLKNVKQKKEFVVSAKSLDHYKEDKNIVYVGQCDIDGQVTLKAEDDTEWQKKTLAEQAEIVTANIQKKTAKIARHRGDPDFEDEDETENSYDEPDGED